MIRKIPVRRTFRRFAIPALALFFLPSAEADAAAEVIITEFSYNISGDDRPGEFVELKNVGDEDAVMDGWRFTQGVSFTFANGTRLAPGQFMVMVASTAFFIPANPGVTVFAQYANDDLGEPLDSGALDNKDERITLVDATGGEVFSVKYWDGKGADPDGDANDFERERWPDSADGDGYSVVSLDPNGNPDPDDYRNWRPSIKLKGSPGADEPLPTTLQPIFINEIRSRDGILDNDAVELFNPGTEPVNIGNWFVTDNLDNPRKNQIPANTMIQPGEFLLLENDPALVDPNKFTLSVSSKGERAFLYSATGIGAAAVLTGWVHGTHTEACEDGKNFARFVGEDGREHFIADDPSLGEDNGALATPRVVITEVMYAPGHGGGLAQDIDYLKIANPTGVSVPLFDTLVPSHNMSIGGFGVTIPGVQPSLAPGEEAFVVSGTESAFRAAYDVDPAARVFADATGGSLSGGGEALELRLPITIDGESYGESGPPVNTASARFYAVLDELRYNDNAPWPENARDTGFSIVKGDPGAPGFQPSSWSRSPERGGTAYSGDVIYLSEVLSHTDLPQTDVIELFNPSDDDVNIGGWFLTDDRMDPWKYEIPPNTMIPAGGFWAVNEDNDANPGAAPAGYFGSAFSISSRGDSVYLFSGDGTNITGFSHGGGFRATENGVSIIRHLNSAGVESFPPQMGAPSVEVNVTTAFPDGAPNNPPLVERAVISEIFYAPPIGHVEFIEIANISETTLALYDTTPVGIGGNPNNNWQLDGVDFVFPGTRPTLAPGERVVVIPQGEDVAAFRLLYGVPDEVTVHGGSAGFAGALNNAGEEVALLRPDKPDNVAGVGIVVPLIQVDSISYDDAAPWPSGNGKSIERIDDNAFGDDPANWQTTMAEFGTPGTGGVPLTGYAAWQPDVFSEAELAGPNTGVGEDFNGDGYINLFAYAFGYSPKVDVDPAWFPQALLVGPELDQMLGVAFRRRVERPDLVYTVEVSVDGEGWSENTTEQSSNGNSDGTETTVFTGTPSVGASPVQLLRVKVDHIVP